MVMTLFKKKKIYISICVAGLLVFVLLYLSRKWQKKQVVKKTVHFIQEANEEKWLKELLQGNQTGAIALAKAIVHNRYQNADIPKWQKQLFKSRGIHPKFLSDNFNKWDFQLWEHALFFKQLADKIVKDKKEPIQALVAAVHSTLKPHEGHKDDIILPFFIWKRGYGVCDRQSWVLAELAYQLGYETRIIWLMNPETGISPHTICEIRKKDFSAIADPLNNIYIPNCTIESFAVNRVLLQQIWGDKPLWIKSLATAHLMINSYAQDYCPRNQILYQALYKKLGKACPRFGADPVFRKQLFDALYLKPIKKEINFKVGFYSFSIVSLRQQMVRDNKKRNNK
jgi:hypothetical protein